jgi:hypothetical protein
MNLLFQVDNDDFRVYFTLKPYPKYEYQAVSKGPKTTEKEAFLKAINGVSNHLHNSHPLGKRNYCFFYLKKSNLEPLKEQESVNFQFKITFKLDFSNLIEVLKPEQSKQKRFREKRIK